MALAPNAAAAPAGEMDDTDPAAGMAGADEGGSDETVLVTICKTADGTYMVYDGDESEAGEAEPAAAEGGEGESDGGAAPEPKGEPAQSMGEALKMAMDILKSDEEQSGGDDFRAGFEGGSSASPAKAPAVRV